MKVKTYIIVNDIPYVAGHFHFRQLTDFKKHYITFNLENAALTEHLKKINPSFIEGDCGFTATLPLGISNQEFISFCDNSLMDYFKTDRRPIYGQQTLVN